MGSQVVLGPEDAQLGPVGSLCRPYLWGTALPLDRDHSDLIILKQLLTGHRNGTIYHLLDDSWQRSHNFYNTYKQLKHVQLERLFEGELASPVAVLRAAEGIDVDLQPLVDEVCGSISSFGGGGQQLQDRLRSEEQHRQEHQLQQAQADRAAAQELADRRAEEVAAAQAKAAQLEQQVAAQALQLQQVVTGKANAERLAGEKGKQVEKLEAAQQKALSEVEQLKLREHKRKHDVLGLVVLALWVCIAAALLMFGMGITEGQRSCVA